MNINTIKKYIIAPSKSELTDSDRSNYWWDMSAACRFGMVRIKTQVQEIDLVNLLVFSSLLANSHITSGVLDIVHSYASPALFNGLFYRAIR